MLHTKKISQVVKKVEKLDARDSQLDLIESSEIQFPRFTTTDLHQYTCESYQFRIATVYFPDHQSINDDFICQVVKETAKMHFPKYGIDLHCHNSLLLNAQIRSRHANSVKYYVHALFINKTLADLQVIFGHSCECKVSSRINGCL